MQTNFSPSRLTVLLTAAFLVGVGSTSAVYWLFVAPFVGNGDQIADVVVSPGSTETKSSIQVQTPSTELSNELEPPKSAVRSLEEVASMRSAYEQQLALRILLSNLDEAQVAELLTQSQDVFRNEDWLAARSAIVQRLAHQNPSRALSLVLEADNPYNLGVFVTNVFKEWSHSNLDEAVSHARTLNPALKETALGVILRERTDLSDNTIRAIAGDLGNEKRASSVIAQRKIEEAIDDPETAWNELAVDLQDDPANWIAIARVAKAWIEESGLSVLDQIHRSLTNSQTRQNVLLHILGEVARSDPRGAFNYALTVDNDSYNTIVGIIATTWANSDPRAALTAAIEIERSSVRKAMAEKVIITWAFDAPKALLEEVSALPDDLRESASTAALSQIASESPKEAANLVAAMQSGSLKTSSARSVVSVWTNRDHRSALEWILNEPGVEDIRSQLLSSIMNRLVRADPELAMSTALAQPIDEDKSGFGRFGRAGVGMELNVVSTLAISDVDKAIELLPQVREGPTRDLAFQTVAQSLVMNDKIDKAFNVAQQVPDSDRERFFLLLSTSWAGTNPKSMLKSLDRFPTKESRSRAAVMLVGSNEYTQNLSDEQVEEARKYISDEHAKALEDGDPEGLQSIFQAL